MSGHIKVTKHGVAAPPREAREEMTVSKTTRNYLSRKQAFELSQWVEERLDQIRSGGWSQRVTAEKASQALGYRVTDGNVRGVASEDPEAIIHFEWPRSAARRANRMSPNDLGTVVEMLDEVLSWNEDAVRIIPLRLRERWTELAKRTKETA